MKKSNSLDMNMIMSGKYITLRDGTRYIVVLNEEDESYFGYEISSRDGSYLNISDDYDTDLHRIDKYSDLDIVEIV